MCLQGIYAFTRTDSVRNYETRRGLRVGEQKSVKVVGNIQRCFITTEYSVQTPVCVFRRRKICNIIIHGMNAYIRYHPACLKIEIK